MGGGWECVRGICMLQFKTWGACSQIGTMPLSAGFCLLFVIKMCIAQKIFSHATQN